MRKGCKGCVRIPFSRSKSTVLSPTEQIEDQRRTGTPSYPFNGVWMPTLAKAYAES